MKTMLELHDVKKKYRLGVINHGMLYKDMQTQWARWRGRPDPHALVVPEGEPEAAEGSRTGDLWALRGVSFSVHEGEAVGIVGRNGAGKSTLLKIISQITLPTEGEVRMNGRVASLLEIGTGFHPELTGRENVFLNGAILGMPMEAVEEKLEEIIAFSEIGAFMDTPVKRYSSGMYVRLAFSAAVSLLADVIILDEVLAVGDMGFRMKCVQRLKEVADEGRTFLVVSHSPFYIRQLCTRLVYLRDGCVYMDGDAEPVLRQYLADIDYKKDSPRKGFVSPVSLDDEIGDLGEPAPEPPPPPVEDPGAGRVRVESVDLHDGQGPVLVRHEMNRPLRVRVSYEVLEPGLSFRCVVVFHHSGICALGSMEQAEARHETTGGYEASVTVPANFLSEGTCRISLSLLTTDEAGGKVRLAYLEKAQEIVVADAHGSGTSRGDYRGPFTGLVRPLLTWHRASTGPSPDSPDEAARCQKIKS